MNIYSIRDRMLDYYQTPVIVHRGEDFLSAVSKAINGDRENEIQQAPEHFEIWRIGEVDDQGNITSEREFICNCSYLIRNGVWKRRTEGTDGTQVQSGASQGGPAGPQGQAGAGLSPIPDSALTEALKAQRTRPESGGGNSGL